MWWSAPKLPVDTDEKDWIEKSLRWLTAEFGEDYLRKIKVVLPTSEYFPDPFSGSQQCVRLVLDRVCTYMDIDPKRIELDVYSDHLDDLREILPEWRMKTDGRIAGQYMTPDTPEGIHIVRVASHNVKEPVALIATLAHEVAHAILLGSGRISSANPEHELLTDLFTVFSGFGIFNANAAFMFKQFTRGYKIGWTSRRTGYLPQEAYGYALAGWAFMRHDLNPKWSCHLSLNVRSYMKTSLNYLSRKGDTLLVPLDSK